MLSSYKPEGLSKEGLSSMGIEVTNAMGRTSPGFFCLFTCLWGSTMTSCLQLWGTLVSHIEVLSLQCPLSRRGRAGLFLLLLLLLFFCGLYSGAALRS